MKKNIIAMLVSGMFLIMSCGPSAEEIAAAEKKVQDSIAEVQRLADETMLMEQQRIQDSLTMVMEQMRQDSIMMAEELARTKKGGSKPKAPVKDTKADTDPKINVGQKDEDKKIDVGQKSSSDSSKKINLGPKK